MSPSLFCQRRLHPLSSFVLLTGATTWRHFARMFDCFLCGYLILRYCQSVRLSSLYPPARTDGECSSHSNTFSLTCFSAFLRKPRRLHTLTSGVLSHPTWVIGFWCWPPFDFQFLALCLKVELCTEGVLNVLLPLPKSPMVKSRFHSVEVSIFLQPQDMISNSSRTIKVVLAQREMEMICVFS